MVTPRCAVATLLYTTDYLPGVFTLGHQLAKLIRGKRNIQTCLVVSRDLWDGALSELSKTLLRLLYGEIVLVDPLRDQELSAERNAENLRLLNRPELSYTLIKARLWELTGFDKVLYLDADTLPLNEEFLDIFDVIPQQKSHEIGGAPDIGWPDMFNSGILMLSPDKQLASSLHEFILRHTSIDGADQGILNQFFNPYCAAPGQVSAEYRWIRLPFIYNVTVPNYGYQSSPAVKYFRSQIRLVHFIGENKPWKGWLSSDTGASGASSYASQWNLVYNEFLESFGLTQFFEEMGLQRPSPLEQPEASEASTAPVVDWNDFNRRITKQESEGGQIGHHETYQDDFTVNWDGLDKRLVQKKQSESLRIPTSMPSSRTSDDAERIFPDSDQDDTGRVAKRLQKLSVTRVRDASPAATHNDELTQQIAATSALPIPRLPVTDQQQASNPPVERIFPSEKSGVLGPERVFPKDNDLPQFSQSTAIASNRQKQQVNVTSAPRVEEVLEMIKEESKPDPVSRHVFDWEDTGYLQEVERVFPD